MIQDATNGPQRRRSVGVDAEVEFLREENARLRVANEEAYSYIRSKIDELLNVLGTRALRPEELDDRSLIDFDPIGIVATTFRHVLETLKLKNSQLKNANDEIQTIFDTVGSALLVVDSQRRIVSFNRQADFILLEHEDDAVGRCCNEVLCAADPGLDECIFRQVMDSGREAILRGKALRERVFDVLAGPVFDDDGEISLVVIAYHDITEARRIEQMKSEFVSTAAHELRTPLATIMGYAELLINNPEMTREKSPEYLKLILNRAEHLSHIVSDLLDISRIEAGEGLKLAFKPCPLDLICREVAWSHEETSVKHPVEFDFPDGGAVVEGDRYALTQVIENLLSNAIKYSPAGGAIRIGLTADAEHCEVAISDRGIGMSEEQLGHVFEKFYRANATNAAIPGTGLGMTIVKHLVDAHQGRVLIHSTPGVGTTVRVRLPRTHGNAG